MPSASSTSSSAFLAILWGGLACGVFDITQAMVAFYLQSGLKPVSVLQSVASGLLGRASFQGGTKTAALGAFLHFFIAFSWAAIYYVASRRVTFMLEKPVMAGLIYGEFVWIIMNFVVLPTFGYSQVAGLEQSVDHYRAHRPHVSGGAADRTGSSALGAVEVSKPAQPMAAVLPEQSSNTADGQLYQRQCKVAQRPPAEGPPRMSASS